MNLDEMQFGSGLPVTGYGPNFFRIAGKIVEGAALVQPAGFGPWAGLSDEASLLALAGEVDVIFLGMGAEIQVPPKALREALDALGVGLEPMNTPAACRSYNICLSEGRRVAAALLPVG